MTPGNSPVLDKISQIFITVRDYVAAHRKALLALAALLGVNLIPSETLDLILILVGATGVVAVPNDEEAADRVWPNSAKKRDSAKKGEYLRWKKGERR
jgi:hypothetical protein